MVPGGLSLEGGRTERRGKMVDRNHEGVEKPTQEKPHFSVSQVNAFLQCPVKWLFRWGEGIRVPSSGPQTVGRAVHAGAEHNNKFKIGSGVDAPEAEVVDVYSTVFDAAVDETEFSPDKKPGTIKDKGVDLTRLWHRKIAPEIHPAEVETPFVVEFEGFPYDLHGRIDVLEVDGTIRDLKTTKRTPSQHDVDQSWQAAAYALAIAEREKETRQREVVFDFVVNLKTPKPVVLGTMVDGARVDRFLKMIGQMAKQIEAGIFYPNQSGWGCDPRYCAYWDLCHKRF